jgi:hypothetical protein
MILGLFTTLTPQVQAQLPTPCSPSAIVPFCVFLHPGIVDEYKTAWSHTLDTLWDTQATGASDTAQRRQIFDKYLNYAILASGSDSIGDLQFDIRVADNAYKIYGIVIYVPPEFQWLTSPNVQAVWTDITNDYSYISTSVRSSYDSYAPGWTRVTIGLSGLTSKQKLVIDAGTYHIRLMNIKAPQDAGLYFFKIRYYNAAAATSSSDIGVGNYPIIIVKSELNPAWVEVSVETSGFEAPPYVSGKVWAEGTTPEGRSVTGVAYFSANDFAFNSGGSAAYKTWLFGLAAGTYTLTAEASGFNPTITDRITLYPGQSYSQWITIYNSPHVWVEVWSKHGTGAIPWHNLWQLPYGTNNPTATISDSGPWRDILLELYDADGNLIGFWASANVTSKVIPASNTLLGLHDDGAVRPSMNTYHAQLVDNYGAEKSVVPTTATTHRHYPSTHWDGHAPIALADYIAGMPNGEYTVEAFVTGYIMDEMDAWQRTFNLVGSNYNLQFDLRRSNWIETAVHLDAAVSTTTPGSTLVLTATDVAGMERGAMLMNVTALMGKDINGADASLQRYNAVTGKWGPNTGFTGYLGGIVIEGWNAVFPNGDGVISSADTFLKDYGLNPSASTHSATLVSLGGNPYEIKMWLTDMGDPAGYYGTLTYPAHVNGNGWYNVLGTQMVSVFLCNSPVLLSFSAVHAYIWISLRSVDFEIPAHSRPWSFPGAEIWVEFINSEGTVTDVLDPTYWGFMQDPGKLMSMAGYNIAANIGKLWESHGMTPYDVDGLNYAGRHEHLGINYTGTDTWWVNYLAGILSDPTQRPTRLPPDQYTYAAYTYGYIMDKHSGFPFQVPLSGKADIEADLIQGGQIRVCFDFLHEGLVANFTGWVRVEAFNANDELVGASIYGQSEPNVYTRQGSPGGAYLNYTAYDLLWGNHVTAAPAGGAGWNMTYPSQNHAQRAYTSSLFYPAPETTWSDWPALNPHDANRLNMFAGNTTCFDIFGFYWYYGGAARTWAGGWPTTDGVLQSDYGLKGSRDIAGWENSGGGEYTIKIWAFDPMGFDNLTGTSDDWRMYYMAKELTGIEVPWGGSVSVFTDMNDLASLRGAVTWFDMYNNLLAVPWAQLTASPGPLFDQYPAYAAGYGLNAAAISPGSYITWLPAGVHDVSVSTSEAPEIWAPSGYSASVSDGWVGGSGVALQPTGTPVPEVPPAMLPLAMFAALAASVWLLRKKTLNVPVLMK